MRPYRQPSPPPPEPKEPEPVIPFSQKHPRLHKTTKMVRTFTVGLVGIGIIWALLCGLGSIGRHLALVQANDPIPNGVAGLLAVLITFCGLIVAAGALLLVYIIGKLIVCKFTGEEFDIF